MASPCCWSPNKQLCVRHRQTAGPCFFFWDTTTVVVGTGETLLQQQKS